MKESDLIYYTVSSGFEMLEENETSDATVWFYYNPTIEDLEDEVLKLRPFSSLKEDIEKYGDRLKISETSSLPDKDSGKIIIKELNNANIPYML